MLLAIDTATSTIGVALHDGSQVHAESIWRSEEYPTVELAPEIGLLMRRVGIKAGGLRAVALAQGPGSYTGLRIGMALAKGIALARRLPLVGVPTLEILAWGQPPRVEAMFALLQGGRRRWVGQWFECQNDRWYPAGDRKNLSWAEVMGEIGERAYVCGEISQAQRAALRRERGVILAPPSLCVRRPAVLADIAWGRIRQKEKFEPAKLSPIYLGTPSGSPDD